MRVITTHLSTGLEALAVAALVAYFLVTVVGGAVGKSKTDDEQTHYAAGIAFLDGLPSSIIGADGTMPVSALNVLALRAARRVRADRDGGGDLFWMRLPTAALGALVLLVTWRLARRVWGRAGGLVAPVLVCLDPNLIAHSKWLTTDVAATLGFVLSVATLAAFAERPSWWRGSAVATAIAAANLAKITNLILLPLALLTLGLTLFLDWHRLDVSGRLRRAAAAGGVVLAAAFTTLVALAVAFPIGLEPDSPRDVGSTHVTLAAPIVPAGYAATLANAVDHNRRGHPAYLLGRHSTYGWPYYYLVALLVKTPLAALALGAGAVITGLAGMRRWRRGELFLVLPILVFLGYMSLFVHVNTGIRHVLPVIPLLAAYAGGVVTLTGRAHHWVRRAVFGLVCLQALELALVFPHHLSYFNQLAGGPEGGWRWLADSNLDWGQDDLFLARWREAHPELVVNPPGPTTGLVTMDVNRLVGLTDDQARTAAWLREGHTPELWVTPVWPVYRIAPTGDEAGPGGSHSTKRAGPGSGR